MKTSEADAALAAGVASSGSAFAAGFSSATSALAGLTGDAAAGVAASVTDSFAGLLLPFAAATGFCGNNVGAVLGFGDAPAWHLHECYES